MTFGITPHGFVVKGMIDINDDLLNRLKEFFGSDINVTGMNPIVKLSECFAEELAEVWEVLGQVMNNRFIQTADSDYAIDLALQNASLTRKAAGAGTTTLTFVKSTGTSITVPASSIVDDNSVSGSLVEYSTDEDLGLYGTIQFVRGSTGNDDLLTNQTHGTKLFDAQDVEWISDNADGSSPYIEGTDYTTYVASADKVTWGIGGSEPSATANYYVKFVGISGSIAATCTVTGISGNISARSLTHLQTPISGISNVFNDNAITNARDVETNTQAINRRLSATNPQMNDEDVAAEIMNLPEVRSAKAIEHLGWFELVVAPWTTPVTQTAYNTILAALVAYKGVGQVPAHVLPLTRAPADPNGDDQFPAPYDNVEELEWVSDNYDGSSPYTEVTDYHIYSENDDEIDWSPGGSEPVGGARYYALIFPALVVAYEVQVWIYADVYLNSGYTISQVEEETLDTEASYFNTRGINVSVYRENISALLVSHAGVQRMKNFKTTIIMRVQRGGGATDNIPLENGIIESLTYISDAEAGPADYTDGVDFSITAFVIDWSIGGTAPTAGNYYYIKAEVDADIIIADREIGKLMGVDLTSV